MQLKIDKHYFYKLDGIANLKNHLEKITQFEKKDSKATGNMEINFSYNDQEGLECFKSFAIPFELDLAELKLLDVVLGKTEVFIVEGQGLDIHYELIVNYLMDEGKDIEIVPVEEEQQPSLEENQNNENSNVQEIEVIPEHEIEVKQETEDLEEIKENISEYYEEKLATNLNRKDEVIVTKGSSNVADFLNFFDEDKQYYKLKCLYVETEAELKQIAEEYKVSLDKLLAGYDRKTKKVLFTI